jgi:FixJ family two-component response regulator
MNVQKSVEPCVFVVDDDKSILTAFTRLLGSAGYQVRAFSSPTEFLAEHDPKVPGCALFDVGMDEVDGLSLQQHLIDAGVVRPIIFVTAQDDARTGVAAMKAGAVDYLTKPVQEQVLLDAVQSAIETDLASRRDRAETTSSASASIT